LLQLHSGHAGDIDAIVSDMVMPGRHSGLAVLEEAARRWPKVGTVLMSGYTENAMIQAGRLPDHVRLLIKPFTKLAWRVPCARRSRPTSRALKPRPADLPVDTFYFGGGMRELRARRRTSP
jgi:DNA-binding NtrC family response regulator